MQKNNFETEMKFQVPDYGKDELLNKLISMGAEDLGRNFENNIVLENKKEYLEERGYRLRVRKTGDQIIVTFKGEKKKDGEFKTREEIETCVDNFDNTIKIFSMLGFKPQKIYQKYRRTVKLGDTLITIDELPFGDFMEIEGAKKGIEEVSNKLSLETTEISNMSYFDLYHYVCEKNGVKPKEHIIFPGYDVSEIIKD